MRPTPTLFSCAVLALAACTHEPSTATDSGGSDGTDSGDSGGAACGGGVAFGVSFDTEQLATAEDTPVSVSGTVAGAGVLTVSQSPAHGAVGVDTSADGVTVTYTPEPNYDGSDAFALTAADACGGSPSEVSFTVDVSPVNDPPVLTDLPAAAHCAPGDAVAFTATATDPDPGDALTFSLASSDCPAGLTVSQTGAFGECPALGTSCTATVSVSDGTATVTDDVTFAANVLFVDATGDGDGTSWAKASGDLAAAMASGLEVWASQSTFSPTERLEISGADGVILRGGFAGTEQFLSERPAPVATLTTLDGASAGSNGILAIDDSSAITVDGFLFTNGKSTTDASGTTGGGALQITSSTDITLEDVGFVANRAKATADDDWGPSPAEGGALSADASDVALSSCFFVGNSALGRTKAGGDAAGGALFLFGGTWTMSDCVFAKDVAQAGSGLPQTGREGGPGGAAAGGAIAAAGGADLSLDRVAFLQNSALGGVGGESFALSTSLPGSMGGAARGGGLSCDVTRLVVDGATFGANRAVGGVGSPAADGPSGDALGGDGGGGSGGGLFVDSAGDVLIAGTTVAGNQATGGFGGEGTSGGGRGGDARGGGLCARAVGTVRTERSSFAGNVVSGGGGGAVGGNGGLARGGAAFMAGAQVVCVVDALDYNSVASGSGGGGASDASALDLSATDAELVLSAVYGNVSQDNSGAKEVDPAALTTNLAVCTDQDTLSTDASGAAASALSADPFASPAPDSSQSPLDQAASGCIDLGTPELASTYGIDWTNESTAPDLALDVTAPDAGAERAPSEGLIVGAPAGSDGVLGFSALGADTCVLLDANGHRSIGPASSGSLAYTGSGEGALTCGAAAVWVSLP